MAYLAPIHRPSSIRHAIKLRFVDPLEECLIVAKANRIEIWLQTQDGMSMAHTQSIYGRITMLQKLRPAGATTDHLFIGTERFQYFTLAWNAATGKADTIQTFIDASEKHMRDSQSLDRCSIDPTGQHMVMELFEGVLNVVRVIRPRKGTSNYLGEPEQIRITELFIRSSTFLRSTTKAPKFAILYQDGRENMRLATYRIRDEKGNVSNCDPHKDRENDIGDLDPGANLLIPVPEAEEEYKRYLVRNTAALKAQLGGVLVVGEVKMLYLDDESKAIVEYAYDTATIFVAWAQYDERRFLLADDYGNLHVLTLKLDGANVVGMSMTIMTIISKASQLVYMGDDILFVASHEGNSQVLQLNLPNNAAEIMQTLPNIAPILDFTVMDLGNRGEAQSNEYSSGQARIVTGSGAFKSGSLRSVRSGVGLEDVGLLGEMEKVRDMFSINSTGAFGFVDTLVLSFLNETRVLKFDTEGEVEEKEELLAMRLDEATLLVSNMSDGRVLQITPSIVLLIDIESGAVVSSWRPQSDSTITAASANDKRILLSVDGACLISLDAQQDFAELARQDLGENDQVACVHVPDSVEGIGLVGFWQSGQVSTLDIDTLQVLHGEVVRTAESAAVPRDIVMTQILPPETSGPTLLVAMSDGNVLTFNVDRNDHSLSGKKTVVLGVQEARFKILQRSDGCNNVFAVCEHASLIYSSEGRIIYSAVTAKDATCICPFDAEVYRDSVVLATKEDIRISQIDTQRRSHVTTLEMGETVRRIAYSPTEKVFGLGTIKKELEGNEEIVTCSFRLVDEVAFGELGKPYMLQSSHGTELVECVIRAELPDSHGEPAERFIVGTSFLDDVAGSGVSKGRIIVFGIDSDRSPYEIVSHPLKGACRCLAMLDGKIVAALVKTVVMLSYTEQTTTSAVLEKIASYRTSTCPIDLAVTGNMLAVADLMKSMSLVEYRPSKDGMPGELIEVARHFQSCWATAVSHIEGDSYLQSDADGNLVILRRNNSGVTLEDRKKLEVTSEINLGEMVNCIRKISVEATPNAVVVPQAFMATTEGSIYLFATIVPSSQDLLMRLQARMAELVQTPGGILFNKYRSFKNAERETDEPFRFVDGELIERFLDVEETLQEEICKGLGPTVEDVRNMVEELKRLH